MSAKAIPLASLKKIVAAHKKRGQKVVFTNGCFDILHPGHVTYLQKARKLGGVLVVGMNSDASVKRQNKGPERPILGEEERAAILGALACVSYVVIFDEDTPLRLIEELVPDVLVKGGDWPIEKIVGREVVQRSGGEVLTIPFVEGKSTTSIIERILTRFKKG